MIEPKVSRVLPRKDCQSVAVGPQNLSKHTAVNQGVEQHSNLKKVQYRHHSSDMGREAENEVDPL